MNIETFEKLIKETDKTCLDIMANRKNDYAPEDDRLENFKIAAVMEGLTPAQDCCAKGSKQIVAVYKMVQMSAKGFHYSKAQWDEKIHDSINYLKFLKAIINDGGLTND